MDPIIQAIIVRLIRTMGYRVDAEYFTEDHAWAFLPKMVAPLQAGRTLVPGVMHILMELGLTLGIRPGAESQYYRSALEKQLGPCPYTPEEFAHFLTLIRGQVNGYFEAAVSKSGPDLTGFGKSKPGSFFS
ncbi:MAG: hypothetical protein K1X89_10455 [Myxococcaceae bacterium]|nr:hypothetical protein [Myxococcaceae bacterium]